MYVHDSRYFLIPPVLVTNFISEAVRCVSNVGSQYHLFAMYPRPFCLLALPPSLLPTYPSAQPLSARVRRLNLRKGSFIDSSCNA